jgi:DNA-binding protein H-NS
MAKTYAQLQQQISQLQREADALKAKEVAEVIGRIKLAITHYGLTPDDLFGKPSPKAAKVPRAVKAGKTTKAVKRAPSPPKYHDGAGNTWTGTGKRPRWFLAAIASGKTPQDLAISPAAP